MFGRDLFQPRTPFIQHFYNIPSHSAHFGAESVPLSSSVIAHLFILNFLFFFFLMGLWWLKRGSIHNFPVSSHTHTFPVSRSCLTKHPQSVDRSVAWVHFTPLYPAVHRQTVGRWSKLSIWSLSPHLLPSCCRVREPRHGCPPRISFGLVKPVIR